MGAADRLAAHPVDPAYHHRRPPHMLSLSSPMWQPLCYAIIFGLLAATVLSFVVVPALFVLLSPRTALR